MRRSLIGIASITLSGILAYALGKPDCNPDIELGTPELAKKYGYSLEIHRVVTQDGYGLELHRIPYEPKEWGGRNVDAGSPVLLQHGLAGSSADWIIMGPGKGLGYILADAEYDVWLGNSRGNVYSRNHTSLSPQDRAFWNFSYHELGVYDLPAVIDYILEATSREKLHYIGHSQGTTQFWVMCSERAEYNERVGLMIGLAPAAFTGNIRGPVTKLAKLSYAGVWVGETFGYPEFRARSAWGKFVSNLFCQSMATTQFLCSNILFLVVGFNRPELNTANLTVIIGHVPAGASWKQFVHYGQGYVNAGRFRRFDYGDADKNRMVYNSTEPPAYNLDKVTAPVALFSSDNDWLAGPKDVNLLSSMLGNVVLNYKIPTNSFNHYDFIWGRSASQLVFAPVLRLLSRYR
ncbi:hypothetical protein KM043_003301 [Ampulex compressa]|nr:hypothetical protein KM043_003301 [Ampulex compressa]